MIYMTFGYIITANIAQVDSQYQDELQSPKKDHFNILSNRRYLYLHKYKPCAKWRSMNKTIIYIKTIQYNITYTYYYIQQDHKNTVQNVYNKYQKCHMVKNLNSKHDCYSNTKPHTKQNGINQSTTSREMLYQTFFSIIRLILPKQTADTRMSYSNQITTF